MRKVTLARITELLGKQNNAQTEVILTRAGIFPDEDGLYLSLDLDMRLDENGLEKMRTMDSRNCIRGVCRLKRIERHD